MNNIKNILFNLIVVKNYIEIEIEKTSDANKVLQLKEVKGEVLEAIRTIEDLIRKNIKEGGYNIQMEKIKQTIKERTLNDMVIESRFKKIEIEEELKKLKEKLK